MHTLPVFYRPEQNVPRGAVSFSPSAAKPACVVASWAGLGVPFELRPFAPLTRAQLCQAHARAYVHGVLDLEVENGFGTRDEAVARSLPLTSGSFVAAALHAFRHGGVAISPTSGFHHAGYDAGGGFCTFNGLALAAVALRRAGARRIGILDCDAHYGDGTVDILERVPGLSEAVLHFTRGDRGYRGSASDAPAFLAHLPELLAAWQRAGVEVVLYQAGADPHVDDPLGCRFLTTEQLHLRDEAVLQTCARLGLRVAWNLAGGYQEDRALPWPQAIRKVLDLHDNTLRACAQAFLTPAARPAPGQRHRRAVTAVLSSPSPSIGDRHVQRP